MVIDFLSIVIPAKAGIQGHMSRSLPFALDPRFRGDDGGEISHILESRDRATD
jgi:hypothetical protein